MTFAAPKPLHILKHSPQTMIHADVGLCKALFGFLRFILKQVMTVSSSNRLNLILPAARLRSCEPYEESNLLAGYLNIVEDASGTSYGVMISSSCGSSHRQQCFGLETD